MRSRSLCISVLVLCLISLLSAAVNAVWVPGDVVQMHEGEQINLDGLVIKAVTIDPDEQLVYVQVKQDSQVIGKGTVFLGEELQISDLLKVSIDSFPPTSFYGKQAVLRFVVNADARITFTNFPEHLNYNDHYKVFAVVENTGKTALEFLVELTEPGLTTRHRRTYETQENQVVTELLKVDKPLKLVTIPAGESRRVEWYLGPNRRQSSYSDSITKVGDVQFNLYAGDALLDSITHYSVKASTEQSGFLADVVIPLVMLSDVPYDGYATIQNTGPAFGGINSRKFGLRVVTPGFSMTPNVIYDQINAHTQAQWGFTLNAQEPGEHLVTFELVFSDPFISRETILDTFTIPVTVIKGYSTRIADIATPSELTLGDQFTVGAVIENLGKERQVDLTLDAPVLSETAQEQRLVLPPNSLTPVSFTLEATTYGTVPLTLSLYDKEGSKWNVNIDPYSPGKLIESRAVEIDIPEPESQKASTSTPVAKPPEPSTTKTPLVAPVPTPTVPIGEVVSEPAKAPAPLPDMMPEESLSDKAYLGALIGGIIVLLLIVIGVIVFEVRKGNKR